MKTALKSLVGGVICFVPAFSLQNLELINAQNAWNQGITGKGVKIGIIDTGFDTTHPALKHQFTNLINSNNLIHGTGVASVAVGAKIGNNPHGVAYNAKFYGLPFHGYDAYGYFKDKDTKVINNSWGYSIYPVIKLHIKKENGSELIQTIEGLDHPRVVMEFVGRQSYDSSLTRLAREKKILSIVSTGNEGMSSAAITATLPRYDESLRSWIAAGALDASYISKNDSGELVLRSKALADFSNGFRGIELFGLSAPGVNVDVARVGGGYGKSNGTSFSSPLISGVAALVLEKFPFLNGAQVADVLLSTANKTYITPKVVLKKEFIDGAPRHTIIYIDRTGGRPSNDQIRQDLRDAGYREYEINLVFRQPALEGENNRVLLLSREEVFGQGILDIQKALGGIALLDANRLNKEDIHTSQNGEKTLLYSIDTQGHHTAFSNDIAQRKWDSKYHHPQAQNALPQEARNLDVGLLKKGSGKLELLGKNTYKGMTFVHQGTLALNKRKDGSGGILESKVLIDHQGRFQGNGIIKSDVFNYGILSPGNADFDTLTIQGRYTQNQQATLEIHFGIEETPKIATLSNKAKANLTTIKDHAKLKASHYTIHGGTLLYSPLKSRFYIDGEIIPIMLEDALKNQIQNFSLITIQSDASQTINFSLRDPFTILIGKKQDAYSIPEIESDLHKALQAISLDPNLAQKYKHYFAFIDSASKAQYIDTLKSLDGDLYLQNTKEILSHQARLGLSDITLLLESSKEDKILFTPSFGYAKDVEYQSYIFSLDAQGRKKIADHISLSGFVNFSNFQTNDQSAKLSSQVLSSGLSLGYDFGAIEIFGGIGAGFGYNTSKREINHSFNEGNYLNALALAHLGLGKTYKFSNSLTLTPLIWMQNLYVYQNVWKETGGIFHKSYSRAHYDVLDASAGLRLGYEWKTFGFGISGFYTRHLLGNSLQNQASFLDFPTQIIHQRYTFDPNAYKISADFSYTQKIFFMSLKVDSDLAKNFWGLRGSLAVGAKY
ncbi:S8 family serine peptidase [Helicobacter pametensis]|uniref:S8 family serine peptidase n=1 Tax=Helicobacter pametensis TaxID=95149 RepID=UPI00047F6768|nr:S8 family serine peptidase [Helicobacter pametensis]